MTQVMPMFLQEVTTLYSCGRTVIALTGDVEGLQYSPKLSSYDRLETVLATELSEKFHVVFFDINGVNFYSDDILEQLARERKTSEPPVSGIRQLLFSRSLEERADPNEGEVALREVVEKIAETDYAPLHCLELLRNAAEQLMVKKSKPLCILVRNAAMLFPSKKAGELTDSQAQRLQALLNWVTSLEFEKGNHLVVLLNSAQSDLQADLFAIHNADHYEIQLPTEIERLEYAQWYLRNVPEGKLLGMPVENFVRNTASLTLAGLRILFKAAEISGKAVGEDDINLAIDKNLSAMLGEVAELDHGNNTIEDVDFFDREKGILSKCFQRSRNPKTAVSVVGVFGPNGGGKTYITEAVARSSGWRILRIKGLRSSDFGGTERLFEILKLLLKPFELVAIIFDEADTDLGDVRNDPHSHEVERRLYGKINAMMSDKRNLGKILWVLMTARPDKLGADIRSRCLVKVPIFDLTGDDRKKYLEKQLLRREIVLPEPELNLLFDRTLKYSNRDLDGLITLFFADKQDNANLSIGQFMETWQADGAIEEERKFQSLIAAQNCTYPELLPEWIKNIPREERSTEIETLKFQLGIA